MAGRLIQALKISPKPGCSGIGREWSVLALTGFYDAVEDIRVRAKSVVAFDLSSKPSFANVLRRTPAAAGSDFLHIQARALIGSGENSHSCHHAIHTAL
jgi:hypothetical protein